VKRVVKLNVCVRCFYFNSWNYHPDDVDGLWLGWKKKMEEEKNECTLKMMKCLPSCACVCVYVRESNVGEWWNTRTSLVCGAFRWESKVLPWYDDENKTAITQPAVSTARQKGTWRFLSFLFSLSCLLSARIWLFNDDEVAPCHLQTGGTARTHHIILLLLHITTTQEIARERNVLLMPYTITTVHTESTVTRGTLDDAQSKKSHRSFNKSKSVCTWIVTHTSRYFFFPFFSSSFHLLTINSKLLLLLQLLFLND
jgi:hypothetical protein